MCLYLTCFKLKKKKLYDTKAFFTKNTNNNA